MIDLRSHGPQTAKALSDLREPGGIKIIEMWASELESAKQKLVHAGDMVMLHRLQGRAEAMEDLLRAAEEASEVVKRA